MKKELQELIESIKEKIPNLNKKIIEAFKRCDRAFFISTLPYEDTALPIGKGQTISQPSTIAKMLQMLKLKKDQEVLEIGTNTGYHACLAAFIVYPGIVRTIEIFPELARNARINIENLKKQKKVKINVEIYEGNALDRSTEIWKHKYDRIYFTAGVEPRQKEKVKEMGLVLLKEGGLILFPTREFVDYGALELWRKNKEKLSLLEREEGYVFVPLID